MINCRRDVYRFGEKEHQLWASKTPFWVDHRPTTILVHYSTSKVMEGIPSNHFKYLWVFIYMAI